MPDTSFFYCVSKRRRYTGGVHGIPIKFTFCYHPVKMSAVAFEFVEIKIIVDDQKNDKRSADANGKPQNINNRKNYIPDEIPVGNADVGFKHLFLVGG